MSLKGNCLSDRLFFKCFLYKWGLSIHCLIFLHIAGCSLTCAGGGVGIGGWTIVATPTLAKFRPFWTGSAVSWALSARNWAGHCFIGPDWARCWKERKALQLQHKMYSSFLESARFLLWNSVNYTRNWMPSTEGVYNDPIGCSDWQMKRKLLQRELENQFVSNTLN